MMPALVPELVNMASDPAVSTTDLLRRALVVARRLGVQDQITWINWELKGNESLEDVPDYRHARGQLVAANPMRGYIPFFAPPEIKELLEDFPIAQSIPQLIQLSQSTTGIVSHFPSEVEHTLIRMMQEGSGLTMRPALQFSTVQINGVIEVVRSRVLDWALDLEGRGVLGEGMTFTQQEKKTVQEKHYHFSNVNGSQIQIGSSGSNQTQSNNTTDVDALNGLIEALGAALDRGNLDASAVNELRAELATIKAQSVSPKPKWEIIKAAARSIKTIAEGAAGNILANMAQPHVTTLLALATS